MSDAPLDPLMALSYARTALTDPGGLPPGELHGDARDTERIAYTVERIDEAMHALDVELHPSLALATMGAMIAEINEGLKPGYDGKTFLDVALDNIDLCIDALDGEGEV